MEAITPFDIPLLNNEICQYLSREDLTRCVLVSKDWAAWFSPALWRDLDFRRSRTVDIHTLSRHWEHVRAVRNICMWKAGTIRELLPLLRLQRLDFDGSSDRGGVHLTEIRVLPVLEKMSTLQHLRISLELDRDNIYQQWIRTLEALPHLKSLILKCQQFLRGKVILDFLQKCHRLERLSLYLSGVVDYNEEEDRQEYRDAKAEMKRMPEMRLCELSLCSGIQLIEENIIQPLLERCPRIERLELDGGTTQPTLQHLSKMLKENKLPMLRHLVAGGLYEYHLQVAFAEVLSQCGLESITFWNYPSELVVQSLVKYHYRSLTKLSIHLMEISTWTFAELMAGLPNLRSFTGSIQHDYNYSYKGLPLDTHWKCVDLRSLRLRLSVYGPDIIGGSRWATSTAKPRLDYVFSEVAKLESLQELIIECRVNNLFLKKHGYLTRLADLKELKVFDLAKVSHKSFGKQEALWMANNWPKLLQVYAEDVPAIFNDTLLEKRPMVEITQRQYQVWHQCHISIHQR